MTLQALLESAVDGALGEEPAFSGVVLIRQKRSIVLERNQGLAQRAEALPNRLDTRFGTASCSKIFTATAVLQLIESGALELTSAVSERLGIPYPIHPAMTVEHLLTHTSGLPDYFDEEQMTDEDCLDLMRRHPGHTLQSPGDYLALFPARPASFGPGERFQYNNGAFVLLALLVERTSGQSFTEYVTEHVFRRAGMNDSGYFRLDALPARTAYGYVRSPGGMRTNVFSLPVIGSGDGGAFVSAPDWGRFWEALLGHRLLGEAMTRAMLLPRVETGQRTPNRRYGYGVWSLVDGACVRAHYVEGRDFGVRTFSASFPEDDLQVTILDNVGEGADRVWRAVRGAIA